MFQGQRYNYNTVLASTQQVKNTLEIRLSLAYKADLTFCDDCFSKYPASKIKEVIHRQERIRQSVGIGCVQL